MCSNVTPIVTVTAINTHITITIFDIKDTTQINIAVKDGQLRIIKIEHSDKKTYMQTLYNYNTK